MKKRLLAILLILFTVAFTACTAGGSASVPAQSDDASVPAPTASERASEPVTRTDYPLAYLPGLNATGVVPNQSYSIGIVVCVSSPYAANFSAFEELAKAYEDAFGMSVTVEQPNEAGQIDSVKKLLVSGIEFLIFVPGGEESLGEADTLCAQSGVPYITIGRRTQAVPGEGSYVCTIEPDDFLIGILTGQGIVDAMTAQYGEPYGNIAEITGVVSDTVSMLRSSGLRKVLSSYDKLNVVCSVAGHNDKDTVYKAAENIFKAYREGELDGIVVPDDSAALTVLQAALDYDRNDVAGRIWSAGATVKGLTGVYYGQMAQTIETYSQTGMAAMEYAVHYLNGDRGFPAVITPLTRVFTAESQEKKDGIKNLIAALSERGAQSCLESMGGDAPFLPDENIKNYPKRYDSYPDIEAYLGTYEPYTTQKAIYKQKQGAGETTEPTV